MAAQDSQRKVGVIPVLGAFSLIAAVGLVTFLLTGSNLHGETRELPSGHGRIGMSTDSEVAAGIDGGMTESDADATPGLEAGADGQAAETDSVGESDSSTSPSTGRTTGLHAGRAGTANGSSGQGQGSLGSSGSTGTSGSTGSSGSSGEAGAAPSGATGQGNGSQPSSGSGGTNAPNPASAGGSTGSPSPGDEPSPHIQTDAAAAGIRVVSGDLQIMTFNTHQSGVTVVFYIPSEMRGFGTRSMIPPMTVAPTSDGRSVTVQVNCHSSADELLGQLSVSETNQQVLIAGAVVIPSNGAPCSGATPLTVELPLRQPLGERLLTVLPRT